MNLGWTGDDVKGFTKIFGNQVAIYHSIKVESPK
jgi:argininosuccinate synthase